MKFSVFYASTFFAFCSSGETFNSTLRRLEGNEKQGSCVLPNATDDDKSYVANCDQNFPAKPGERVPEGIALWFVCNHGYGRDKEGDRFRSVCSNGSWLPPIQPCLKKCGKPTVLEGIEYKCYNDNQEIECNGEYLTGTKLRASCSLPHHHPNHMEIICDVYGKWNIKNIKCVADCGIYLDEAKRLYKNTYMPWHVLIKRHAFGNSTSTMVSGSLIAPNLVISADTIFTNQAALPLPAELFEVIINIFISPAHRKSLKVKHILLPPGYINTKKQLFNKDSGSLVLLYLAEKVELSATVMPICVDWNNTHILPKQSPLTGKMLEVSDLEGNETTQNEAYLVNLTLGSSETCNSMRDLQHDQFCLQSQQKFHFRESLKALEFTTGGGYYVESLEDHLYYIVGVNIVQLFIRDTNQNERTSIFTNITTHIEWLNTIYKGIDAVDDNETIEYHDCGKYSDDAKNLYQGKYSPWHVLVESSFYGAIHSGTLVAPNLVLTGAKIAGFPNNDTVFAKYFKVIVNGFLDERQQKTYEVKEVYRLPGFSHGIPLKEQSDDIAVLHLVQDVTISSVVQPVCLDWTGVNLAPTFLPITGKMIHTGDRTTPTLLHNETQIVNMKFLDAEFCKWWTGTSNLGYDRFCARGKGLGDNDMGGGYYVQSPKDGLFYMRGISVLLHSNEGVVVYTDVTTHMEWLNMINKKVNGNDKRNLKPPISSSRNLNRSLSDFNCDNDESNRCYLVPQYNIVVTEVICAKANEKCLIHSSSDDKTVLSETKIRYKCKNGYFPDGPIDANTITTNLTTVCQNNKWFPPIPQCHLYTTISQKSNVYWKNRTIWTSPVFASECGKPSNAMLLIWNGNTAKPGEFPWHAAIYESEGEEKRQPFCGATIISSRYLLSAAHCFADEENEMTMRNSSLFQVVVGIIKSHHDSKEDFKRHYEIKDIITRSYGGTKYRYQNDLAIIMTKNEIIFNSNVLPICLINNFFPYIPENTELWVAGFGFFNSSEIQSENLMSLEVPFISYEECFGNPNYSELSTFLTPGKFCTTRKKGMGKSIDAGDSGGGLVAKGPNDTYFLVGVISLTVKESPVVLCTYVPQFHRWISEVILDQPIS